MQTILLKVNFNNVCMVGPLLGQSGRLGTQDQPSIANSNLLLMDIHGYRQSQNAHTKVMQLAHCVITLR